MRERERERNRVENERKKIAYSTNSKRTIMHTHMCTHIRWQWPYDSEWSNHKKRNNKQTTITHKKLESKSAIFFVLFANLSAYDLVHTLSLSLSIFISHSLSLSLSSLTKHIFLQLIQLHHRKSYPIRTEFSLWFDNGMNLFPKLSNFTYFSGIILSFLPCIHRIQWISYFCRFFFGLQMKREKFIGNRNDGNFSG